MNKEFIKFEADVQRQHARYRLPLTCAIGDRLYSVSDWSVAGLSIAAENAAFLPDRNYNLKLVFPFDGYDFIVSLDAVSERGSDPETMEFRYINVDAARLRLFRYILDAYLAGEIVTAGEILDVSRRQDEPAGPKANAAATGTDRSPMFVLGQALRLALVTAISVGLVAFVGGSIAQRLNVIPTESAAVTLDSVPLLTPNSGVLTNVVSGVVARGQMVATIMLPSETTATLFSPCDCTVASVQASIGSNVAPGDQIATLRSNDPVPYVQAWVRRENVMDLYRGVTAEVELYDGTVIRGVQLAQLPVVDASAAEPGDLVEVRLDVPAPQVALQVDRPVVVRFIRNNLISSTVNNTLGRFGNWFGGLLPS
ncbi:HlyD family efflux transporter periplasmic adaptor subunit [Devosia psychrophila]|uniref:Alginate biosynthesis protein Alg44 n=1 Tax=Devosia psychrophila TaxID=728005 RepID=A0A0F5PZ63_9HYPH|nr:HlyD family efflux transporter periplasmic adaptor subunit [Devosia psychrophila]KKC33948.1 hypothetical protein WH91_05675 [Devosia psychrophila]SFD17931.1 alginate biosynthesis protein Alg44 [Devosia psychrophila]